MLEKSTYYILDARSNQINMYEHEVSAENAQYNLVERNIYGSSRLGTFTEKVNMLEENTSTTQQVVLGHKYYELSNHLGNFDDTWFLSNKSLSGINPVRYDTGVLTVIKDIKIPIAYDECEEEEEIPNPYFNPDGTIALHNLSLISNTCNQIGLNFNDPPVSPANHEFIDIDNDGDLDMRVYSNAGPYASEFAFSARITFNSIPGETYNLEFTLNEMNYVSFLEVYPINCGNWINNGYLYANANGNYSMQTTAQGTVTEFKFLTYKQNQNINGQFVISNLKITGPGEIYPFETPTNETLCGNPNEVAYYEVAIASIADYSPFGVQLDERTVDSEKYRRGFNGMEKDDEIKNRGNSYDFGARMHDPRLGRFLSIDPLARKYPFFSPYIFAGNCPIRLIDVNGEEPGDPVVWSSTSAKKGNVIVFLIDPGMDFEAPSKDVLENWDIVVVTKLQAADDILAKVYDENRKINNLVIRTHGDGRGSMVIKDSEGIKEIGKEPNEKKQIKGGMLRYEIGKKYFRGIVKHMSENSKILLTACGGGLTDLSLGEDYDLKIQFQKMVTEEAKINNVAIYVNEGLTVADYTSKDKKTSSLNFEESIDSHKKENNKTKWIKTHNNKNGKVVSESLGKKEPMLNPKGGISWKKGK
jgi:RHS repeat-associated protein